MQELLPISNKIDSTKLTETKFFNKNKMIKFHMRIVLFGSNICHLFFVGIFVHLYYFFKISSNTFLKIFEGNLTDYSNVENKLIKEIKKKKKNV